MQVVDELLIRLQLNHLLTEVGRTISKTEQEYTLDLWKRVQNETTLSESARGNNDLGAPHARQYYARNLRKMVEDPRRGNAFVPVRKGGIPQQRLPLCVRDSRSVG